MSDIEIKILEWVIMTIIGGGGYLLKRTVDHQDSRVTLLEKQHLEKLQVISEIKQNWVHKEDMKEFKAELRSMFEEIKSDIRELKK